MRKTERLLNHRIVTRIAQLAVFVALVSAPLAEAAPPLQAQYFTFQSRITDPATLAVPATPINVIFQILDPSGSCVLYTEEAANQAVPSAGVFVWNVGSRAAPAPDSAKRYTSSNSFSGSVPGTSNPFPYDYGNSMASVYVNNGSAVSGYSATGATPTTPCTTSYTPSSGDGRLLMAYWSYTSGSTWQLLTPAGGEVISAVPVASVAETLAGLNVTESQNLVQLGENISTASSGAVTFTGNVMSTGTISGSTISATNLTTTGNLTLPNSSSTTAGAIWYNSATGQLQYYNGQSGTSQTLGVSGSGLSSLNGQTGTSQTFATGASGTAPAWSSSSNVHTLNIPMADTAGVTAGLISNAEYSTLLTSSGASSTYVPLAGGTMTGPLVNNSSSTSTAVAVTQSGTGAAATFMGGNVGIGTTSPGENLTVSGTASVGKGTNNIYQDGGLEAVGDIGLNSPSNLNPGINRWTIRTRPGNVEGAFDIYDDHSSASRLFIDSNGNVGIGTTAPACSLNVARAPLATVNAGAVSFGEGAWDGTTGGYFVGNAQGTELAINSASSFTGDLANFEVGGVSKFKVDYQGNVTEAGTVTNTGSTTDTGTVNINTTGGGVTVIGGGGGAVSIGTSGTETVTLGSSSNSTGITGSAVTINSTGSGSTALGGGSGAVTISSGTGTTTIGNTTGATTINGSLDLSGMTSGSVLYAGASGAVSQDNANFYWDSTNHRLGIGTATPKETLDVNGAAVFRATAAGSELWSLSSASVAGQGGLIFTQIAPESAASINSGFKVYTTGTGASGTYHLGYLSNLTAPDSVSDAMVVNSSGNVGIGTTTPNSTFQVVGTTSPMEIDGSSVGTAVTNIIGPVISNTNSTTDNWSGISFSDTSAGVASAAIGTQMTDRTNHYGDFAIATRSAGGFTEKLRVTSGGNVGIGTTAPAGVLSVARAPAATANAGAVSFGEGAWDGTTAGYFVGNAQGTELAVNSASSFTGDLANFEVGGVSKFKVDYQGNVIENGTVNQSGTTNDTGAVNINTTGGGVTMIGGGGGAVSIGTSGSETVMLGSSSNTTGITGSAVTINSTGAGSTALGGGSGAVTISSGTGTTTIGNTTGATTINGSLDLSGMTSGSVLYAGASGAVSQDNANFHWDSTNHRLGIGTASPGPQLDVRSQGDGVSPSYGFRIQASDYATNGGYLLMNKNSGSGTYATIQSGDSAHYQSLGLNPNGGNVGIGTTAPAQSLTIGNASAGTSVAAAITSFSGGDYLLMGNNDSTGVNNPAVISAANGAIGIGGGTSWSGNGGTVTPVLTVNQGGSSGTTTGVAIGSYASSFDTPPTNGLIVSGNVGIGTASPSYPLEIMAGAGNAVPLKVDGQGGASGNDAQIRFAGQKDGELWAIGSDVQSNNGSKDFHIYDLPSSITRLTVQQGTGNVGIGTTAPAGALNVARAPAATANAGAVSFGEGAWDGTTAGYFVGNAQGTELAVNSASSFTGDLANFEVGGVSKFKVDYQGNVTEIGTVNQSGTTNATGAVNINTTGGGVTMIGGGGGAVSIGTSGSETLTLGSASNTTGITGSAVTINSSGAGSTALGGGSGAVTISSGTGTTTIGNTTGVTTINGSLDLSGMTSGSVLYAGASGAVSQDNANFYWDSTNHRLGIGTTSPQRQLHVLGGNSTDMVLENTAVTSTSQGRVWDIANAGSGASSALDFRAMPSDLSTQTIPLTLLSNGNVGIGTTSPGVLLDINGGSTGPTDIRVTNSATNYGPEIRLVSTGASGQDWRMISNQASNSGGTGNFSIYSVAKGADVMVLNSSGYVGIGTTAPNAPLSVKASATDTFASTVLNQAGNQIFGLYNNSTGAATLELKDNSGIAQATIATNGLSWFNGGNLGIGTASPIDRLSVQSTANDLSDGIRVMASDAGTNGGYLLLNKNSGSGTYATIQAGDTGAYRSIAMNPSGGSVGVGTTTPQASLDVNGEVKVGNSGLTCSATTAGATRYNSTDKDMEVCNGTVWTDFAPSGTLCGNDTGTSGDTVILCKGVDPKTTCPTNYTQEFLDSRDTSGTLSSVVQTYTCVKN